MWVFHDIWLFMTGHGYGAVIEFVVDLGDHVATHIIAIVFCKAGVAHVGWRVLKRVRARKARTA